MMEEVSHKEIYERLILLEGKVNALDEHTKGMVDAFEAAQGAFKALNFIASVAKPLLTISALLAGLYLSLQNGFRH